MPSELPNPMQEVYQMDNNPVGTTTTPNMTLPKPQSPSNAVQNAPATVEPPKSSKKMILMLIAGLVVAVVLIGGAYFYVSSRGVKPSQIQTPPAPQTQEVLDTELNRVNVEDLDTEFATVEADLQNL